MGPLTPPSLPFSSLLYSRDVHSLKAADRVHSQFYRCSDRLTVCVPLSLRVRLADPEPDSRARNAPSSSIRPAVTGPLSPSPIFSFTKFVGVSTVVVRWFRVEVTTRLHVRMQDCSTSTASCVTDLPLWYYVCRVSHVLQPPCCWWLNSSVTEGRRKNTYKVERYFTTAQSARERDISDFIYG